LCSLADSDGYESVRRAVDTRRIKLDSLRAKCSSQTYVIHTYLTLLNINLHGSPNGYHIVYGIDESNASVRNVETAGIYA